MIHNSIGVIWGRNSENNQHMYRRKLSRAQGVQTTSQNPHTGRIEILKQKRKKKSQYRLKK